MQISEKEIIALAQKYLKQSHIVLAGPGHDCAVVKTSKNSIIIATTDQLIEGIHYEPSCPIAKIARKLLARNLSDIAASGGGKNFFALCTIAFSPKKNKSDSLRDWFKSFFLALGRYSKNFNISVCGGDIAKIAKTESTILTLSIMAETEKEKVCSRSGAQEGDILFATGYFGNSFKSGHHYNFEPRVREAEFVSGRFTRTMTDVSDGLLSDAMNLAKASDLGIILNLDKIPLRRGADLPSALTEGEDYELLFAVSPKKAKELRSSWQFKTKLNELGRFAKIAKGKIISEDGIDLSSKYGSGYDHFLAKKSHEK